MTITHFNAQLKSNHTFAESLSGRLGPFVFRTYPDGVIRAHYLPKRRKNGSSTVQSIVDYESLYSQLREIAESMGLQITQINYDYE